MKTEVQETYECWKALGSGCRLKPWGTGFAELTGQVAFASTL